MAGRGGEEPSVFELLDAAADGRVNHLEAVQVELLDQTQHRRQHVRTLRNSTESVWSDSLIRQSTRDAPDKLSGRIVDFSTIRYPAG